MARRDFTFDLTLADGSRLGFEWDETKDAANRKKHGIGFAEAATMFCGHVLTADDLGPDLGHRSEAREVNFGRIERGLDASMVICVAHTERNGRTRITSARKATAKERKRFNVYIEKTYG